MRICDALSSVSDSLPAILRQPGMPSRATVYRWLRDNPRFRDLYLIARQEQFAIEAERLLQTVDDPGRNWLEFEKAPGLDPDADEEDDCDDDDDGPCDLASLQAYIKSLRRNVLNLLPKKHGLQWATEIATGGRAKC